MRQILQDNWVLAGWLLSGYEGGLLLSRWVARQAVLGVCCWLMGVGLVGIVIGLKAFGGAISHVSDKDLSAPNV
jgi:hypothetical protein